MVVNLFYTKVRARFIPRLSLWLVLLIPILALSACNRGQPTSPTQALVSSESAPQASKPAAPTPTSIPPTATPEPLVARVNGMGITLAEYQAELALYRAGSSADLTAEDEQRVLNDLIDRTLLAQAAAEQGFIVDETLLQERILQLNQQLGSEQALKDWMAAYSYTETSFRLALERSIAAAWMRDQIAAATPKSAEQVHARQILLYNSDEANDVLAQLNAGNDFGNLALKYDPTAGGDLGWFPRGYLLDAHLEEIAFGLEPEQISPVVETLAGFHIIQVLERDLQHPLTPQELLLAQIRAVQDWLQEHRTQSNIEIISP